MWYHPSMLVPVYRPAEVPATVMWPVVPFHQQSCLAFNDIIDERRFLLNMSVYDLVKVSHFLELSDQKLLGWYLSLAAEDRKLIQDEGGLLYFLHRHPALEVFEHIVHLKQNHHPCPELDMSSMPDGRSRRATFYYISQCVTCGISCPGGAKKCSRCSQTSPAEKVSICEDEKTLQLLPNNVRAELNLLITKGHASEDMSLRSHQQFDCMQSTSDHLSASQSNPVQQTQQPRKNSSNVQLLCQMWEEREQCDEKDLGVFKDPAAQASFSLDGELEMQGTSKSIDHNVGPQLPGTSLDLPHPQETAVKQSCSPDSTIRGHTPSQWSDTTNTSMTATKGSPDVSTANEPVACGAETCTFPDSVSCISNSSEWTDLTEDLQTLSSEEDLEYQIKTDEFHSLVDEDTSSSTEGILCFNPSRLASGQCTPEQELTSETCILSASQNALNGKPTTACEVCPVRLSVSHAVDASNDFRACFTSNRSTEITQDLFVKHWQNVSTDSDSCPVNQKTQTIQMLTSEKCIITEVFMSDLDAVCEEFGKLRMMTEELMHLKDEMARSGPGSVGGPRSEPHESPCGCGAVQRARWAELRLLTLQFAMCQQHCWRSFYTSQGEATLQGTKALPDAMSQTLKSLEDSYVKMKNKILEGVPLDNMKPLSVDTNKLTAPTCYKPSLIYETFLDDCLPETSFKDKDRTSSLEGDCLTNHDVLKINIKANGNLNRNAAASQAYAEHDSAPSSETVNSKRSRCMPDLSSSDDWFDAEEELGYESQSCKEDQKTGQSDARDSKKEQRVEANRKEDQSVELCVSNLPNSVTERDLSVNQVSLCNSTNTRVAIESVRNPSDAEAAVREMNGRSIEGHTVHVEHVYESPKDSHTTIKKSCVQLSHKARSARKEPIMHSTNYSGPLRCSLDKLTNLCTTPTATGTCVPQHYGTMGSFDMIMSQVSERHPKMGRPKIICALLELREKHCGVLSGLPLGEIVDMTSEILTHSTTY
ncbi:RNA-binding protein 44 isoform 2-T2 [Clarias gariepinus]